MFKIIDRDNMIPITVKRLQEERKKVVLYGAGYCGHEALQLLLKNNVEIVAVCDDFRVSENLDGYMITDIRSISPNEQIVILITSGFNEKMKENLRELGLYKYYLEIDFGRYEADKENYKWYKGHIGDIEKAYDLLEDDRSRKWMQEIINYKICRDISIFMGGTEYDKNQYFPIERDLDLRADNHVFMDLGAYDGDSCKGFIGYTGGKYEKIIAVEASEINYNKLIDNMNGIRSVEIHNVGIYSRKTRLRFEVNDAKNSFASERGDTWMDVDTIDNIIGDRRVSFIKMDIEGAEYDALLGAIETIRNNTPILAVSVYHYNEDIYRIQLLIQKIHPHYRYYLRHYSPTAIETILYAVPREEM